MERKIILSLVFLLFTIFQICSQTLDQKIFNLDSINNQIDLNIAILKEKKDSIQVERKKLIREKALNQLENKNISAKVSSDKTPLKESVEDSKALYTLNRNDEVEILGASDNYLFVRKDDMYGYVSPLFLIKDNEEINDFIDGLIEQDKIQKSMDMQIKVANRDKEFNEQVALREKKRIEEIKRKFNNSVAERIINKEIWIGMTREMATSSKGFPSKINRTVMASIVNEQWVYSDGFYLYFENGNLKAWQD